MFLQHSVRQFGVFHLPVWGQASRQVAAIERLLITRSHGWPAVVNLV